MSHSLLSDSRFLVLVPVLFTALAITYPLFQSGVATTRLPKASSLAALSGDAKAQVDEVYPEDIFPGGAYADFPAGRVRYWLLGPEDGRKIVLIHGLSIPAITWKHVAPRLAAMGFRVLVYDIYGRGYSDAPLETRYDVNLYTTQCALLMQHVRWEKAIIVGFSMGGAITTAFTAQFPWLVEDKIVIISSVGLMPATHMPSALKLNVSAFMQNVTPSSLGQKRLTPVSDPLARIFQLQSAYLPHFSAAILSTLRHGPLRNQHEFYKSSVFNGKRVLLIHGNADPDAPYKCAGEIMALLPEGAHSVLVTVEGGKHELTTDNYEEVITVMKKFLEL